jgi:hypothetical protein
MTEYPWEPPLAGASSLTLGRHASLRRLVCDLIEEYGRHTGHADLLRETVDGLTGEDPPADWRAKSGQYHVGG